MLNNPRLLLIQVNTYLRQGDFARASASFEQARSVIEAMENAEQSLANAELAIAQGELYLQQGEYSQAQERFRLVLEQLPIDERVLRIRARQPLGLCMVLSGQPIYEGIAQFQQGLGLCHPRLGERLIGELHHQLANAYGWAGNYVVAEHHRQRICKLQESSEQPSVFVKNLTGMGVLRMRQGQSDEAEPCFRSLLERAEGTAGLLSGKAYALLGLGELEWERRACNGYRYRH